jgi:putative membrane protein
MKILVLCVDRDDDIGSKTGLKGPLIGREDNLAAATKLGLADPEDSDVNALLCAVSTYDGLVREAQEAEVATICGDTRVGATSDLVLARQLDQVLEEVRPDRVFLISDGAEDEAFAPIVGSRIRVDHIRRVYVRQTPTAESLYYTLGRQLKNPKVRRKIIAPLGLVLLLFGAIQFSFPFVAPAVVLILAGLYLLIISLPIQSLGELLEKAGQTYGRVRDSVASGDLSIFFNVSALILVIVGVFFGVDSAQRQEGGYVVQFLTFLLNSVWFFVLGTLTFEAGHVLSAYLRHGRAPRHVLAVAVTFIALGFIVLATINILGVLLASYNPQSALLLIYLSIALAMGLVATAGLSYRTREPRGGRSPPEPIEDGWRH